MNDVENTVKIVNDMITGDYSCESILSSIIVNKMKNNDSQYIVDVLNKLDEGHRIIFMTWMRDFAITKSFDMIEKPYSTLYLIPFIAFQGDNVNRKLSSTETRKFEEIIQKHVGKDYDITAFNTIMTPFGLAKDPIEINSTHDCVVAKPIKEESYDTLPSRIQHFYNIVSEDEKSFNGDNNSITIRYIIVSARTKQPNISIEELTKKINNKKFNKDMKKFLSSRYKKIAGAMPPMVYIDGIEHGLLEYRYMYFHKIFNRDIKKIGAKELDIVISQDTSSDDLLLEVVDKNTNKVINSEVWPVIIYTDHSLQNTVQKIQLFCKKNGFASYLVNGKEGYQRVNIS